MQISDKVIFVIFIPMVLIITSVLVQISFGELNNTDIHSIPNVSSAGALQNGAIQDPKNDFLAPSLNISYPFYPLTLSPGKVLIEGTANDSQNGILNVSAAAHTFPFDGSFPIKPLSQPALMSSNNWSRWFVPFIFNNTGTYRVVIEARDNAGNTNYTEITVNVVPQQGTILNGVDWNGPKIAFVRPTFTEAAYQEHGFYRFYDKYGFPLLGKNISTDLDLLTVKIPRSVSEFWQNDIRYLSNITALVPINGTELHDISYNYFPNPQKFWIPFIDQVKKVAPDGIVTVIRDEDIHDGHVFYHNNMTNAYDVLLLSHNEYVTQSEYDNLRQFVKNGGTIVFIDANVFRAEVSYDKANHEVTLVKGHDWEFDGKAAQRSVPERWYSETKTWVGSNFLDIDANITFTRNAFNYTHLDEQFVNNPNVTILADYGIKFPTNFTELYLKKEKLPVELQREHIPIENIRVATYSLDYGKGKVIMLGLSGRHLAEDSAFMKFFERSILPKALYP